MKPNYTFRKHVMKAYTSLENFFEANLLLRVYVEDSRRKLGQ